MSHATEDKERFVLPFAERLRAAGIDAWVDVWEMLPGDSLVKKIFVEAYEEASAVIVVLSRVSIQKRWVAEELDAAVVKRINTGTKLIPIVLDQLDPVSEVPASIRHLVHLQVPDPSDLDRVVASIVRAIHGEPDRPPLEQPPGYATASTVRIEGLDRVDVLVLEAAGESAVRTGNPHVQSRPLATHLSEQFDVTEEQVIESLDVLGELGHAEVSKTFGRGISGRPSLKLTPFGLDAYLRAFEPAYDQMLERSIARLAGWATDQGTEADLARQADVPSLVARHVLMLLDAQGLLKTIGITGGGTGMRFHAISPRLRRSERADP